MRPGSSAGAISANDGYNMYMALDWHRQELILGSNRTGPWTTLNWTGLPERNQRDARLADAEVLHLSGQHPGLSAQSDDAQ